MLAGRNFTVDAENLFCLYKRKKWFLYAITATQRAGNHGDVTSCNIIFKVTVRDIYINFNLEPLTWSSRSTKFNGNFPWNISQMITKTIQINSRIVISCAMKSGIKVKGNLGKNIRICQLRGNDCRRSKSSEERNKSKIVGLWESLGVRDWSGKVSNLTMLDWTALWVPPE